MEEFNYFEFMLGQSLDEQWMGWANADFHDNELVIFIDSITGAFVPDLLCLSVLYKYTSLFSLVKFYFNCDFCLTRMSFVKDIFRLCVFMAQDVLAHLLSGAFLLLDS